MQSYLITLLMFACGGQREQVILGITLEVNLHILKVTQIGYRVFHCSQAMVHQIK